MMQLDQQDCSENNASHMVLKLPTGEETMEGNTVLIITVPTSFNKVKVLIGYLVLKRECHDIQ